MRSRTPIFAAIAALLLAMWCVSAAQAADDTETADTKKPPPGSTIEVEGGVAEPRIVHLQACPLRKSEADELPEVCSDEAVERSLGGRLTLLVSSKEDAALSVGYLPSNGTKVIPLATSSDWVFLNGGEDEPPGFSESKLQLKKGVLQSLSLGFELPPDAPASAIDGELVLQDEKGGAHLVVPLSGDLREFKDVSASPKTLSLDSDHPEGTIVLSGSEVVEFMRFGGFSSKRTVMLHGASGHTAEVTVEFPPLDQIAEKSPRLARGTVKLKGSPSPGKYTGKLPFSDLLPKAPSVEVEVNSRCCFIWFILLAFLGVLLGGLATRLVTFAIRRRQLLELLKQSKAAYDHVRALKVDTASWRLGDLFGETEDGRPVGGEGRLQGLAGLETSIRTARSSKDLDEDTDRALDMIARIQRWLRLEPAARRLVLVDEQTSKDLGEKWLETKTWRDTQILLEIAQREPADVKAADDLVTRLLRQAEWHHQFAAVWGEAKERKPDDELSKLDTLLGDKSTVGTRTPAEQDVLDEALLRLLKRFPNCEDALENIPKPVEPGPGAGVTPVLWKASPNLFTGWAILDGPSYGQLAEGAARGARSFKWEDLGTETKALLLGSDAVWTFASLVLACTVYALAKYDDTWGSTDDLVSAFLAGVMGTIAINWAALPIFQSIRVRASGGDQPAGDAAGAKKGDADKPKAPTGDGEESAPKPAGPTPETPDKPSSPEAGKKKGKKKS